MEQSLEIWHVNIFRKYAEKIRYNKNVTSVTNNFILTHPFVLQLGGATNHHEELIYKDSKNVSLFWLDSLQWARASFPRFLDDTQRRTTVGRTPLDE